MLAHVIDALSGSQLHVSIAFDHAPGFRCLPCQPPAVFLGHDGALMPIVERPEDTVISDSLRDIVLGR
jgi:hypothetical protein